MRKTFYAMSFTLLTLIAIAGCGGPAASPLVGSWEITEASAQGKLTMDFKADGTSVTTVEIAAGAAPMKITANGTYKLVGETLTMTGKEYTLEGVPKAAESQVRAGMDAEFKKETTQNIKWSGNDELTLTRGTDKPMIMKRVKK